MWHVSVSIRHVLPWCDKMKNVARDTVTEKNAVIVTRRAKIHQK